VTKHVKQGANRPAHARRAARAAQHTDLPPRCLRCRRPGTIPDGHGGFTCLDHVQDLDEGE